MFNWLIITRRLSGIISWFQEMYQRHLIRQEVKNEIRLKSAEWINNARDIRDNINVGSDYTNKLLAEIQERPSSRSGNNILSSLRTRLHQERNSARNKDWHLEELCNLEGKVYRYSEASIRKLETCHGELQIIALEMSRKYNCTVVCGTRSLADQQKAYNSGASKVKPGDSKHNCFPSNAIDLVPYEAVLLWKEGKDLKPRKYKEFSSAVFKIANEYNIKIRWGGDWDLDGDSSDQTFMDFAHYERV